MFPSKLHELLSPEMSHISPVVLDIASQNAEAAAEAAHVEAKECRWLFRACACKTGLQVMYAS